MEYYNYCIGNPPFNIVYQWEYWKLSTDDDQEDGGKGNLLSQNLYIQRTFEYLKEWGVSAFIVPDTWLETELRDKKVKNYINTYFYHIVTIRLPKNTFQEYEVDFPTKVLVLMKKVAWLECPYEPIESSFEDFPHTQMGKWFYSVKYMKDEDSVRDRYQSLQKIKRLQESITDLQREVQASLFYYRKQKHASAKKTEEYQIKCDEILAGDEEFEEIKKKLLSLKKSIKRACQTTDTKMLVHICLGTYSVRFNRSNPVVSKYVNTLDIPDEIKKNDIIVQPEVYEKFLSYLKILTSKNHLIKIKWVYQPITVECDIDFKKYFEAKIQRYQLNTMSNEFLSREPKYQENFKMLSNQVYAGKKLLPHQLEDLSWALIKPFALLSWDTGLWKTLWGIVWSRMKGGKTLIVAPAVNILDPWDEQIREYLPDTPYFLVKKSKDIHAYTNETYVICSLESLPKIIRSLRKIKFKNLILDESDNIKSKTSKRAKVVKTLARRIKNKLLMSGTPTRNNVWEIYNQLELLCNNSVNMLCRATNMIEYDHSTRKHEEVNNKYFMKPFPAYGGYQVFRKTFCPKKITCFWAEETNQNIFNKRAFDRLMKSVRFTREFDMEKPRINRVLWLKETGEYKEYKQVVVPMNDVEKQVYEYLLTEFVRELEVYYQKSHDSSTASKLVIMQQIMNLLQGTSHPWTYPSYRWEKISTKMLKAREIIKKEQTAGNKIIMGSPWVETMNRMQEMYTEDIPVFRLAAEDSKGKRSQIIRDFRTYTEPALLVGTLWVLKSWLNLPEVNAVIVESYPWNFAQLQQFVARAIRLNSKEKTNIYCLCSEKSFDINVFSLILRKEVTNTFVRTSGEVTIGELTKDFWTTQDLFSEALKLVKENIWGRTRGTIQWSQKSVLED